MIDLYYEIDGSEIYLYKLEKGNKIYIKAFEDREDLLIFIEKNFDYANLIIVR